MEVVSRPPRPVGAMPDYLLLNIAPHLDHKSIQRLRCTSKHVRALLDRYEHGMTKAVISNSFGDVLEHLGPYGILCSRPERPAVNERSYLMIGELENRRKKIDYLVGESYLRLYWDYECEGLGFSSREVCQGCVDRKLRRALWICCDLADCDLALRTYPRLRNQAPSCQDGSACVYHNDQPRPSSSSSSLSSASSYSAITGLDPDDEAVDLGSGLGAQMLKEAADNESRAGYFEPTTYVPIHQRDTEDAEQEREEHSRRRQLLDEQKQLLWCSSTEDLASVLVLAQLTESAFCHLASRFDLLPTVQSNARIDWAVSAAENTLRHGIYFLFTQCQLGSPAPARAEQHQDHGIHGMSFSDKGENNSAMHHCGGCCCKMAEKWSDMICDVVDEIHQWELGFEDALPGLLLTIRRELARRLDVPMFDVNRKAVEMVAGRFVADDEAAEE